MRSGSTIIFLLSLIGTIGSAFGAWNDYLSSVTDLADFSCEPTCTVCTTDTIPSSMTIQHTEGLTLDFKFNATLIAVWEKITSAYVTHFYKGTDEVSGLGCTTNYQYVEKTSSSWTIFFQLEMTYESSSTSYTSQQLAQQSFSSLTEYNTYLATTGLSIESTEVICAKTPFPTQAPVTKKPTKSPTKKPVTKKPTKSPTQTPVTPPTKNPVTKKPTKSPTKAPVASESEVTASPTTPPVAEAAPIPVTSYPTASPTKAQSSTIPSTMTITSSIDITFNAEFIANWEQTTSEYMTLYYQNTTEASTVQCYTKYDSYEMIDSTHYKISYTLYVYVQYSASYTYSYTEVTQTAAAAFSSQYKKAEYDLYFYQQTGYYVKCKKVVQSSSAPTLSPVEASSTVTTSAPSSSPVAATVITSTVEGSMNYTYTGVTQVLFSESNIEVIAKATGMYITNYYRYNSNVQDLQVTANYQGSTTYECGCTTIVYFSFEVSYTSSTLTTDEILTKPFESNLAQLAYEKVLSKLGIQVELDGASLTDTYRASAVGESVSGAAHVNTGLLTLIAGVMGSMSVLLL